MSHVAIMNGLACKRFVKRTVWATALPKLSALRLDLETIRKSTRVMDLQQSLPCFRFYLSGTCTHCGRAPKKKLQSTWSIRPRLLTHVHEQTTLTTLSRYRWYTRNLEFTCPVVHFALEVQDMPKSDAEIFPVNPICLWAARNGKTSPSRPSTEALMPLHHFGETIWHYGLCRVCAKHLAEWTIWTIRLSIFCIVSRHVSLQVYQKWMKLKSEDYN